MAGLGGFLGAASGSPLGAILVEVALEPEQALKAMQDLASEAGVTDEQMSLIGATGSSSLQEVTAAATEATTALQGVTATSEEAGAALTTAGAEGSVALDATAASADTATLSEGLMATATEGLAAALTTLEANPIILVVAAIAGLAMGLKSAAAEGEVFDATMQKTETLLTNLSAQYSLTADEVHKMAQEMARATGENANGVQAVINMGLQFGVTQDQIQSYTQAVQDLATAQNGGARPSSDQLAASAKALGKAMADPAKAAGVLKRAGVVLSAQQQNEIALFVKHGQVAKADGVVLDAISSKYGGMSQNVSALSKASGNLGQDWRDFADTIGPPLLGILAGIVVGLEAVIKFGVTPVVAAFDTLKDTIALVAAVFTGNWDGALHAVQRILGDTVNMFINGINVLIDAANHIPGIHLDPVPLVTWGQAADDATSSTDNLTTSQDNASGSANTYKGKLDALKAAYQQGTLSEADYKAGVDKLTQAHNAAAAAATAQKNAEDQLAGGLLGLVSSIKQVNQDQAKLTQLRKDGKAGTQEYSDAELQLLQDQDSVNGSLQSYMGTLKSSGDTQQQAIDKVVNLGQQVGLTKKQVLEILGPLDQYKGKLDNIPSNVNTTVTTNYVNQGAVPPGGSGQGRRTGSAAGGIMGVLASGGITQGPSYLVGEGQSLTFAGRGAEAVLPLNTRGIRILAEAVKRGQSGSNSSNVILNLTLNGFVGDEEKVAAVVSREMAKTFRDRSI